MFFDIPRVGDTVAKDEVFGTVEAVKTVSDLFMPLSGEVLELNEQLDANPELVNQDPYGKGWMVKNHMTDASETGQLLDASGYKEQRSEELRVGKECVRKFRSRGSPYH